MCNGGCGNGLASVVSRMLVIRAPIPAGDHSSSQSPCDANNFRRSVDIRFFSQSCRHICGNRARLQEYHFAVCTHIHVDQTNLKILLIYNLRCGCSCDRED